MTEQTRPIYVEERERLLEKAKTLPLPDAVFAIVDYNLHYRLLGPRPHAEEISLCVLDKLGRMSADLDFWRARASSLRRDAYPVGEALLRERAVYDAPRRRLILDHPGFSEESYEAAISFACFQAR